MADESKKSGGGAVGTFWSFISVFRFLLVFVVIQSFLVNLPPINVFGVNLSFASQALFGTSRYFTLFLSYILLVAFIIFLAFNLAKSGSKIYAFIEGFLDAAYSQ